MVPFVRIPAASSDLINFALSAGAGGVMMPCIQNAEQAQKLVRLARFPPMGDRSFPPAALINAQQNRTPEGQTTYDVWNNHAAVICQIEDLEGLRNVEEICKVPGGLSAFLFSPFDLFHHSFLEEANSRDLDSHIKTDDLAIVDGVFVGTGDLRKDMGLATGSLDGDEPQFIDALQRIRDAAKANNLPTMGFGISPTALRRRINLGWNAFIVHGDIDAICTSAVQSLELYSEAAKQHVRSREGSGRRLHKL